jgi:hypothetical protein
MEEKMKYLVYKTDNSNVLDDPFDTLVNFRLYVGDGVYRFYKGNFNEPSAVYPVVHFYVIKEG